MVELNEKALEAAHHAYQTHGQMGDLKTQRLSDSCLTAVITAYLAALPEEVVFCPNCGWNSAMDGEALPAPDDGLVERLLDPDYAGELQHLRSWSEIDRLFREAATALQSKDEQIERLTRERDVALENYTRAWNERDAQRRRAETAEQQVQKLTAENERLREALGECKEALLAAEDRDNRARFRANTPRGDAEVVHLRTTAIRRARTTLQKEQADGK